MHSLIIEKVGQLNILRDDLIEGGTKRRGLEILLKDISTQRVGYAGTVMGHGALALAHACQDTRKIAEIYICGDEQNPMIQKIMKTNAIIHLQKPMPVATLYELVKENSQTVLPPAFSMPEFETAMAAALQSFDIRDYSEIWTCTVTGTLTRALKHAFPNKIFQTVSVVKSTHGDYAAPEKYHQTAKTPPPYPSCPHTDAKVWQFAEKHAKAGALIWNTAG